jgi:hypothetical protein
VQVAQRSHPDAVFSVLECQTQLKSLRRDLAGKVPFPAQFPLLLLSEACHPKGRSEVEEARSALTRLGQQHLRTITSRMEYV